ncbi:MAG: prolyl oligopeptidase family serine peptidase [Pacificimonas sp.]|nr:prolyl oligopeptidase family serine peptidase [Pacificimonas sp.]
MRESVFLGIALLALGVTPAAAQEETFGGAKGADLSIEAMEPTNEPVDIGLAGDVPYDIARYLLAGGASSGAISPDGALIATTLDVTGQPELWVIPADGGQPRQMTFRTGVDNYRWVPDGSGILYQADKDGDEQPSYFFINRDGTEERVVLPAARGDFRSFGDFAADGQSFVYSSTARNGQDFDIYRATLDGETELIAEGEYFFGVAALSPDGSTGIVSEAVGEDANNLYLLDMADGALTLVSEPSPRASHTLGGFAWTEDSAGFYYSSNVGREFGALSYFDVASGETRVIAETDADIADIELCGAGDRYLAYTISRDGFEQLVVVDREAQAVVDSPTLPEGLYALDCAGGSNRMAITVNGWRTPGDIYSWEIGSGEATRVYVGTLAGIDPDRLVRPEVVRYPARDGVALQGLLYQPTEAMRRQAGVTDLSAPPPVLFRVHGGPSGQSVPRFDAVTQYHVNNGMAVFLPNVRGSTGLGRTYSALDDRERRLDSVRDLVDLLAALGDAGLVDPERAAVTGGSYGGYMVNAVLASYPGSFRAGASLFGVGDWVTALEIASPGLKASDRVEFGDISEPRWRDFYTENSPVALADQIRVPVLYSHGVMDPRIDIAESEIMVKVLRANGVEAPFVRIPDEGHGWRKLSNQLFYFRTEAAFLEEQLGLGGE